MLLDDSIQMTAMMWLKELTNLLGEDSLFLCRYLKRKHKF